MDNLSEFQHLFNEYLGTLDSTPDYWDSYFMSERDMASEIFEDFMTWLEQRHEPRS